MQVYVKGITLMMFLTNMAQFTANFYFWMDYMQDQLLKDEATRTDDSYGIFDQVVWSFLQTVPNLVFLFFFYLYYLSIIDFVATDAQSASLGYSPILLTTYTGYV